jgi:hypothetical protein
MEREGPSGGAFIQAPNRLAILTNEYDSQIIALFANNRD